MTWLRAFAHRLLRRLLRWLIGPNPPDPPDGPFFTRFDQEDQ
jgi:hypothetical protein